MTIQCVSETINPNVYIIEFLLIFYVIQGVPRRKTSIDIGKSINRKVLKIRLDTDVGMPNLFDVFPKK